MLYKLSLPQMCEAYKLPYLVLMLLAVHLLALPTLLPVLIWLPEPAAVGLLLLLPAVLRVLDVFAPALPFVHRTAAGCR